MVTALDPAAERDILRDARRAVREGRGREALETLRVALRRGALGAHAVERAGELARQAMVATGSTPTRALLLGQCTTSWLGNALTATALQSGLELLVEDGQFDNVLQEVAALPSFGAGAAPVLVLLPWHDRLLSPNGPSRIDRVESEVGYWRSVWAAARERGIGRIVQIGYDWIGPGALGFHLGGREGDVRIVREVNDELASALPGGSYFVNLDQVSGMEGRRSFYDRRGHYWARQPFSERGVVALAEHVTAGIRALTIGPRKAVVLDLDNTLWGGVVGELGPQEIVLGGGPDGEAYVAFQHHLKALSDRGVLLAVCSKNNPADAREPFATRPELVLTLDDFAAFDASWDPKVEGLRRIASSLNLGLDSLIFFDDNPAEREHVRLELPEVLVVDVPADPAEYVSALEATLAFETLELTAEDAQRRQFFNIESQRRKVAANAGSMEEYLRSLEMKGTLRALDASDLPRATQLIAKTNQFNLTTRRHAAHDVRAMLELPRSIAFTLRLSDRFGDHGLVAVVLAVPDRSPDTLRVDTLLMSCRVIGRTAETLLVRHLVREARRLRYGTVRAEYIASTKNSQVSGFWSSMGFRKVGSSEGAEAFELSLAHVPAMPSFVEEDG